MTQDSLGIHSAQNEGKRQELIDDYTRRAIASVDQALAKGYNNLAHLQTDPHLAPLRERDDFKKLLDRPGS
jgi:hypothetical protein